jgi:hypothetical protein
MGVGCGDSIRTAYAGRAQCLESPDLQADRICARTGGRRATPLARPAPAHEGAPAAAGKDAAEAARRARSACGASDSRPRSLNVELMAKHEKLDPLRPLGAKAERERLEQATKRPVEKRQHHVHGRRIGGGQVFALHGNERGQRAPDGHSVRTTKIVEPVVLSSASPRSFRFLRLLGGLSS